MTDEGRMTSVMRPFFFSPTISLSRSSKWSDLLVNIEGFQRDIDDAVCTKHHHKPDEAPHDSSSPCLTLSFISGILDEFKHTPEKHDKRTRYEE